MSSVKISLPEALKTFVDSQVRTCGFSTSGEYVRELNRKDQDRQYLRQLLLEGAASPQTGTVDADTFDHLRSQVRNFNQK